MLERRPSSTGHVRLGELRNALRRSRYATSKPAVEIQRQIEEFRAGALGQILSR